MRGITLVLVLCTSVVPGQAEKPLARWLVTVDLGRDLGQNFGSLFEVRDRDGQLVAGAGFMEAYNTRFRGDRHTVQFWGQRITGMIPIGDAMFLSTSAKGTYEWYDKYDFLTDKQRREYGAVLKLTMPGNLAASITWTDRPLVLDFVVEEGRMVIRQDGRQIGSTRLASGGGRDFSKAASKWGQGIFGPLSGRLVKRDPR